MSIISGFRCKTATAGRDYWMKVLILDGSDGVDDPRADAVDRFTALYDTWCPRVLAYALTHSPQHVAEDIVSETFIVAWRRLPDVPEPALPWLLGVARNVRLKHRDGQRRQEALAAHVASMIVESDVVASDVADVVVEQATALRILATLSADDLELLILTIWQGVAAHDAARILGCTRAALFVRLHRARRRLRKAVQEASSSTNPLPHARATT